MNLLLEKYLPFYDTISILGYCISPVILIAFISLFVTIKTSLGITLAIVSALLSTFLVMKFLKQI